MEWEAGAGGTGNQEAREVGRKGRKRKEETGWTAEDGGLERGGDRMGEELYTSKLNL